MLNLIGIKCRVCERQHEFLTRDCIPIEIQSPESSLVDEITETPTGIKTVRAAWEKRRHEVKLVEK